MKKVIVLLCLLLLLGGCSKEVVKEVNKEFENTHYIEFDGNSVMLDDKSINEYDYVWHLDRDREDEYYTGDKPKDEIYLAHDIIFYPEIDENEFSKEEYDGEIEWVCHYTSDELKGYIFSTLPVLGENVPTEMMHSSEEAYNNPVLHINKAGDYVLSGEFKGQIYIDLGEDAFYDESKKVILILNGLDIACDVAPAIVFRNVYECDNTWEERETYSDEVDLSNAGARIVLVDGAENSVTGANVYRMLKPTYKKEGSTVQKKRYKTDGALYSYMSMLVSGDTGILNITSTTYEGLDSELHMTIDGGYINIVSNDDGINVNEDNVSVFTMDDGRLTIFAGQGYEGDVIDSNGYIRINGGTLLLSTPSIPDDALDSEDGTYVSEKAKVITTGASKNNMGGMPTPGGDMRPGENFDPNNMPEGFDPNNRPEDFDPNNRPEGMMDPPEKPQG